MFINKKKNQSFNTNLQTTFKNFSITFQQKNHIKTHINTKNNTKLITSNTSSKFIINLSPPIIQYIYSSKNKKKYQTNNSILSLT